VSSQVEGVAVRLGAVTGRPFGATRLTTPGGRSTSTATGATPPRRDNRRTARPGPSERLLGGCWVPAPGRVLQLGGWLGHAWV